MRRGKLRAHASRRPMETMQGTYAPQSPAATLAFDGDPANLARDRGCVACVPDMRRPLSDGWPTTASVGLASASMLPAARPSAPGRPPVAPRITSQSRAIAGSADARANVKVLSHG